MLSPAVPVTYIQIEHKVRSATDIGVAPLVVSAVVEAVLPSSASLPCSIVLLVAVVLLFLVVFFFPGHASEIPMKVGIHFQRRRSLKVGLPTEYLYLSQGG